MPSPCPPFTFTACQGPFLFEVGLELPAGYTDRLIRPGGPESLIAYSEVENTLRAAFHAHPADVVLRGSGGESVVRCGAVSVYRPLGPDPNLLPPVTRWVVEVYLYCPVFPMGYRDRCEELAEGWVRSLATVPLPEEQGDLTIEVRGPYRAEVG